ncbi:MAG TPA: hypothetical protein VM487_22900 [Phycisphaerae bacterium]|nr:hypothetical protein [Phycisphaerae bacterium]
MRITICLSLLMSVLYAWGADAAGPVAAPVRPAADLPIEATVAALVERHGQNEAGRIRAAVRRVAQRWTAVDGSADEFSRFCQDFYVTDPADRERLLARLETVLTTTQGHLHEISRSAGQWMEFAGEQLPGVDELLAAFSPAPDLAEQLYAQRIAFLILLNFEPATLERMQRDGPKWSTDQWVAARLTRGLPPRIPGDVQTAVRHKYLAAKNWIYSFHPHVGALVDADGKRLHEPGTTLLPHWKVRDEVIQAYDGPDALPRQRALMWCMRRFIDGTLPEVLLARDPDQPWDPQANTIGGKPVQETIGLVRYEHWLEVFRAEQLLDPYYPEHPTALARSWDLHRELPVARAEQILIQLLKAPVRGRLCAFVRDRLGRPLEAHDVYFDRPFARAPAAELDAAVAQRFKGLEDFGRSIPAILREVGFSDEDADWLASRIRVERSRDAGHSTPPGLPEYGPWLTTSLQRGRFNFAAYGTAMHELGHAVEQAVSIGRAPRPALKGVPGSCAVEAVANIFCDTRFKLVDVKLSTEPIDPLDQMTIETMLSACQIAGPAIVELRTWRWLYEHPDATAAELRDAVLQIAADVWTEFFEEYYGPDPYHLTAAYQHMIGYPLYLANYVLSGVAVQQMRAYVREKDRASELLRMYTIGRLTPDLWMERAVGAPLSVEPLLRDTERVLAQLGRGE